MLIKQNNNFFFRKRILKNKLINLLKTNKSTKKLNFKRFKSKKTAKVIKFKKLFSQTTYDLFNPFVKNVLKKRLKIKKQLKIFYKRRLSRILNKSFLKSRVIYSNSIDFSFKWVAKINSNVFNQLNLTNFIIIFSDKNDIQIYNLSVNKTYSLFINYFFLSFDTWSSTNSTFFKNYLTIYKQIFLNSSILYKNNFFINNKISLVNPKMLVDNNDSDSMYTPLKPVKTFSRILNLISKQLPYIELVRSFRLNLKKKILLYDIDINSFFKSNLLRVNQDSEHYRLNITKYSKFFKLFKFLGLLKLHNFNKSDNLFESSFDSNLLRLGNTTSLTRKYPVKDKVNIKFTKLSNNNSKNILNNSLILNRNVDLLFNFSENITLYKYLTFNNDLSYFNYTKTVNKNNNLSVVSDLSKNFFNSRINIFNKSNLVSSSIFKYTVKRKLLKIVNFHKFSSNIIMWYYNILIRFIENCSGKKVYLKFNPFIENALSFTDIARCNMWSARITSFQRILGPKIFLQESLRILHIAIKFKDPTFLSNWIKGMLYRMSFWKYRLLFRYLKYTMRYLFWLYFPELEFKGFKLRLKGKISVAGNARTRTLMYRIGETSYSKLNNRIVSDFTTINTFTGVLGFKIWFFF